MRGNLVLVSFYSFSYPQAASWRAARVAGGSLIIERIAQASQDAFHLTKGVGEREIYIINLASPCIKNVECLY